MYFIDFLKNMMKKSNVGVFVWLVLNTMLVTMIFGACIDSGVAGYVAGALAYIGILVISLSPIGEWILRVQNGCKKIQRQEYLGRLTPLFNEVYAKAKKENPEIPDNVQFYMSEDNEANAFATGRRTICLTTGLLRYPDNQIKSILAHEFGHLAHKDTDAILIVSVGNLIVTGAFIIWRFVFNVFANVFSIVLGMVSESIGVMLASLITKIFIDILLVAMINLWTKLGVLICLHAARKNEKLADEYTYNLGYGQSLCVFLDGLGPSQGKGLWATLNSTHPDNDSRIAYLQSLGCEYRG